MRAAQTETKTYYQSQFSSLPKLRDFDWRLDIKIASKNQERIKKPTLYVKLDIEDEAAGNTEGSKEKSVLFELNKN